MAEVAASEEFVGRRRDLASLSGHLDAAASGRGRLTAVVGEAGIGKTRLCEELIASVPAGVAVAWAACWEAEAVPAYWPWTQLLDQLGAGPLAAAEGATVHERFAGVAPQLREATVGRTLVAVVDDAHWADEESARLLAFLAPALRTLPVLLVATRRPEVDGEGRAGVTGARRRGVPARGGAVEARLRRPRRPAARRQGAA